MDCVRLALVNLYKASPKQSHQSRFFLCFFTIYSITETPFINCSQQFRYQNRTCAEQSYHYSCGHNYTEILVPFPFKLTYNCSKQLEGLYLCKNSSKLLTATQATAYNRWMIMRKNILLTIYMILFNSKIPPLCQGLLMAVTRGWELRSPITPLLNHQFMLKVT